jgi:hypothetical protein
MPSLKWDHISYRRSARTVLTWRGNASGFDQVWSICRAVVVSSSSFVQLWTRNGCLVMCMHLKYLFVSFQGVCTFVWRDVGKRGLTHYDASDTNQNSQIFVRRVKVCEESGVVCTFRCVVHVVNMEGQLIEHVRCRPLLYDPSNREYRNQNVRKEAAISCP